MTDTDIKRLEDKIAALEQKFESHLTSESLVHISKIYQKTKTVVFVGRNYFGDNIKYAYLAFCAQALRADAQCFFLTEDPKQYDMLKAVGLPCLKPRGKDTSHETFKVLLETKVAVLTDTFFPQPGCNPVTHALLQGAQFIQLWHGIPLKEIGLKSLSSSRVMAACGPYEALVATNIASQQDWAQRFAFKEFAPVGYPRNDVFFRELSPHDLLNVDRDSLDHITKAHEAKVPVILYTPTFRDHIGTEWLDYAHLDTFADFCREKGYDFYVNLHPFEHQGVEAQKVRHPKINFIANHTDIYPIVRSADLLITDYSSLAFDYLLLDRPLIFYRPDHEDYIQKSRKLIDGRDHYTSGPVAYSVDKLIEMTATTLATWPHTDKDPYKEKRRLLREELFDSHDGQSAERVCQLIMRHLNSP